MPRTHLNMLIKQLSEEIQYNERDAIQVFTSSTFIMTAYPLH